jgi:hypothetical protein
VWEGNHQPPTELCAEVERLRSELLIAKTDNTVFRAKAMKALERCGIKEI